MVDLQEYIRWSEEQKMLEEVQVATGEAVGRFWRTWDSSGQTVDVGRQLQTGREISRLMAKVRELTRQGNAIDNLLLMSGGDLKKYHLLI